MPFAVSWRYGSRNDHTGKLGGDDSAGVPIGKPWKPVFAFLCSHFLGCQPSLIEAFRATSSNDPYQNPPPA
jgi:hypothetical protein